MEETNASSKVVEEQEPIERLPNGDIIIPMKYLEPHLKEINQMFEKQNQVKGNTQKKPIITETGNYICFHCKKNQVILRNPIYGKPLCRACRQEHFEKKKKFFLEQQQKKEAELIKQTEEKKEIQTMQDLKRLAIEKLITTLSKEHLIEHLVHQQNLLHNAEKTLFEIERLITCNPVVIDFATGSQPYHHLSFSQLVDGIQNVASMNIYFKNIIQNRNV
jgi:hypothetical protein